MNASPQQLVRDIRSRWRDGAAPDARAAVEEHPALSEDHSAVVDLAYEEFCLRRAAGEPIDLNTFCDRFPGCRSALRRTIEADIALAQCAGLFDSPLPDEYPLPGTILCDCELIRELGVGAFAHVYLARDPATGNRPVVLKVSRLATGEASTLGVLDHPHIVDVLWARQDPTDGWYVVCMPFVGAATLIHVIDRLYPRRGTRPPAEGEAILDAIASTARAGDPAPVCSVEGPSLRGLSFVAAVTRLGRSLAQTLAHLHRRGLAHGDMKPANVLLAAGGQPLLLDFNLSRGGPDAVARVGGTFPYMAPEHLEAFLDNKLLSADQAGAADVFSLGVILYELLSGELPFGEPAGASSPDCARDMLQRQARRQRSLGERNPQVPAKLAELIDRCLRQESADRPTADAVAEALTPRPNRLRRWLTVAAGVLLLAALPLLGAALTNSPAASPGPDPGEAELRQKGREQFAKGRSHQEKGETKEARQRLAEADESLRGAIAARAKQGDEQAEAGDYFDLGKVRLLLGDAATAQAYFLKAHATYRAANGADRRHGPTLAYLSFCHLLLKQHKEAVSVGEQALEAGARTPALLNNLAYSLIQQRTAPDKAARYLAEAIRRDPKFSPAYRNRAFLGFMQNQRGTLPAHALADIDRAIESCNRTDRYEPAGLYLLGVELYAFAAWGVKGARGPEREWYCRRTGDYLERAARLGANTSALTQHPQVVDAVGEERLKRIAALKNGEVIPSVNTYLAEPRTD